MTDVLGIISFVCATTKEQILANMGREIENTSLSQIEKLLGERRNGKPLAYITEKKEFYSQEFFVDKNVLVPRPETEILVEEALNILAKRKDIDGHTRYGHRLRRHRIDNRPENVKTRCLC